MSQPSISLITNEVIHSVNSALFVSFLKDGYDKMLICKQILKYLLPRIHNAISCIFYNLLNENTRFYAANYYFYKFYI